MSYDSSLLEQEREWWHQEAERRGLLNRKESLHGTLDSTSKGRTTCNGCTAKEIIDTTEHVLSEIYKFDEPIWSSSDFLLLVDCINGLSRDLTDGYTPSKELQTKYLDILSSLSRDLVVERTKHRMTSMPR